MGNAITEMKYKAAAGPKSIEELKFKAAEIRKKILNMCIKAGTGHVTSSLSCVEILVALYYRIMNHDPNNPEWDNRDRLILSKAQASPTLYSILGDCGYYDEKWLDTFAQVDGKFGVHLQGTIPGVEISCGSLGNGFGTGAGIALGAKMDRSLYLVFAVLGDGELYEGSIWETAMFASHNKLNNLIAIVDRNFLCTTDFTENLVALEPLEDKWRAFGWDTVRIDGHDMDKVVASLSSVRTRRSSKPLVIIADTVKGKGVDSWSNDPMFHGVAPKGDAAERARTELERSFLP